MLISIFYFPFFYSVPLHLGMTLLPRHHCSHQVPSHLLPQLNHWSSGDAKAAWSAAVKWKNMHYSPFCAAGQMLLRYAEWQSLWGKWSFSLYLYFKLLVSNINSRDDLTGTHIRVIDPRPDQNSNSLLEMKCFFQSQA